MRTTAEVTMTVKVTGLPDYHTDATVDDIRQSAVVLALERICGEARKMENIQIVGRPVVTVICHEVETPINK